MIVVRDKRQRPLPFDPIAISGAGEVAYYIQPDEIEEFPIASPTKSVISRDGAPWLPNIDMGRLTVLLAGNPGAGKSYLATQLIKLFPDDAEVLLFTALDESDGNFARLGKKMWKIKMDPEILSKINLTTIRQRCPNPILLFDDIDKIRDKKVEKLTFAILEDALANGRGHRKHNGEGDVHTIVTSHALNDYRKTKYTLENSDFVVLFPGSTTYRQLETMFKKLGLDDALCKEMYDRGKRGDFRGLIIHKVAPMYILAGREILLI